METILNALNPSQQEAVEHIDGPMLILAGRLWENKNTHCKISLLNRRSWYRPCQYTYPHFYEQSSSPNA